MTMRVADPVRPRRATGATVVLLGAVGVLVVAFFQLQVVGRSEFELKSRDNRLRPITIPPARGAIYDRRGRVLADNVPQTVVNKGAKQILLDIPHCGFGYSNGIRYAVQ